MQLLLHIFLSLITHLFVLCLSNDDEISYMPLYGGKDVNFKTYGGYLSAQSGALYYLFSESSNDPDNDPLVLWLNGGPGCSSLLGAFTELGPYHVEENGDRLEYNPYSWNNYANMLFVESPPCVGFSYPYSRNCSNYTTNDEQTAVDNYYAIQSFLDKYTEYQDRPLYITGESYAGHYIPTLATRIIDENAKITNGEKTNFTNIINLSGIGIGNPYTQRDSNFFEGWLPQMYSFGIVSKSQRDYLLSGNCSDGLYTGGCETQINNFLSNHNNDINVYDVNVRSNCSTLSEQQTTLLRHVMSSNHFEDNLKILNIYGYPYAPCDESNLKYYLNTESVYTGLNVDTDWIKYLKNFVENGNSNIWKDCSDWYGYNYTDGNNDMSLLYPNIIANNIRVLIYSGNDDLVCAYLGSRYWVYGNISDEVKGESLTNGWTSWHVNGETGGWYESWTNNFTFLVVRDAGHEVPEFQPERAYVMMRRFLINNFSDATETLADDNFEDYGESSEESKENHIWYGIAIGASIMIGIDVLVYVVYCLRKKAKGPRDGQPPLLDDHT